MSTTGSRAEAWYRDRSMTDATRMGLVVNELDEFAGMMHEIRDDLSATRREVRGRLNWLVGLVFTLLVGVSVAAITFALGH